jgi:hypothetical protein
MTRSESVIATQPPDGSRAILQFCARRELVISGIEAPGSVLGVELRGSRTTCPGAAEAIISLRSRSAIEHDRYIAPSCLGCKLVTEDALTVSYMPEVQFGTARSCHHKSSKFRERLHLELAVQARVPGLFPRPHESVNPAARHLA